MSYFHLWFCNFESSLFFLVSLPGYFYWFFLIFLTFYWYFQEPSLVLLIFFFYFSLFSSIYFLFNLYYLLSVCTGSCLLIFVQFLEVKVEVTDLNYFFFFNNACYSYKFPGKHYFCHISLVLYVVFLFFIHLKVFSNIFCDFFSMSHRYLGVYCLLFTHLLIS